jgi:hypothetical protein
VVSPLHVSSSAPLNCRNQHDQPPQVENIAYADREFSSSPAFVQPGYPGAEEFGGRFIRIRPSLSQGYSFI